MGALNAFRVLADCSHLFGVVFLIVGVLRSKSSVSFSLRSMELYFLVFLTRYVLTDGRCDVMCCGAFTRACATRCVWCREGCAVFDLVLRSTTIGMRTMCIGTWT